MARQGTKTGRKFSSVGSAEARGLGDIGKVRDNPKLVIYLSSFSPLVTVGLFSMSVVCESTLLCT